MNYVTTCQNCVNYENGNCNLWDREIEVDESDDCCDHELSIKWSLDEQLKNVSSLKKKSELLQRKLDRAMALVRLSTTHASPAIKRLIEKKIKEIEEME